MAGDDKPAESGEGGKLDAATGNTDGGSGRNRSRRSRRGASTTHKPGMTPGYSKFEGSCEGLKGYVYDVLDHRQADAYAKTT